MIRMLPLATALSLAVLPAPAVAAAGNFVIVNRTGAPISTFEIRRTGTTAWKALPGSAAANASAGIDFSDPDCAFDLRVGLTNGEKLTFGAINLCDVNSVVLNRNASGSTWVDYG